MVQSDFRETGASCRQKKIANSIFRHARCIDLQLIQKLAIRCDAILGPLPHCTALVLAKTLRKSQRLVSLSDNFKLCTGYHRSLFGVSMGFTRYPRRNGRQTITLAFQCHGFDGLCAKHPKHTNHTSQTTPYYVRDKYPEQTTSTQSSSQHRVLLSTNESESPRLLWRHI